MNSTSPASCLERRQALPVVAAASLLWILQTLIGRISPRRQRPPDHDESGVILRDSRVERFKLPISHVINEYRRAAQALRKLS